MGDHVSLSTHLHIGGFLFPSRKTERKLKQYILCKYADNSKIGSGVSDKKKKKGSMSVVDLRSEINEF